MRDLALQQVGAGGGQGAGGGHGGGQAGRQQPPATEPRDLASSFFMMPFSVIGGFGRPARDVKMSNGVGLVYLPMNTVTIGKNEKHGNDLLRNDLIC